MNIKFTLLSVFIFVFSIVTQAQWNTDANGIYYNNGNVGIGTNSDSGVLFKIQSSLPSFEVSNSTNTRLQIGIPLNANNFAVGSVPGDAVIRPLGNVNGHNGLVFNLPMNDMDGNSYFAFGDNGNGLWMKIYNDKNVRIDGKLYATEIEVKTNVWADFVFKPEYELMSLDELEGFIKENDHLPGIPSEKEVIENGINLSEMNAKLLQKVEELTLYVIELKKDNEKLAKEVNNLK